MTGFNTPGTTIKGATVVFSDEGAAVTIGNLPEGARLIDAGVFVDTAFDDSATLDIGVSGTAQAFASALDVTSKGLVKADVLASSSDLKAGTDPVAILATLNDGTGSVSAGEAQVWFEYAYL